MSDVLNEITSVQYGKSGVLQYNAGRAEHFSKSPLGKNISLWGMHCSCDCSITICEMVAQSSLSFSTTFGVRRTDEMS